MRAPKDPTRRAARPDTTHPLWREYVAFKERQESARTLHQLATDFPHWWREMRSQSKLCVVHRGGLKFAA